jgi:hypothetical protein
MLWKIAVFADAILLIFLVLSISKLGDRRDGQLTSL